MTTVATPLRAHALGPPIAALVALVLGLAAAAGSYVAGPAALPVTLTALGIAVVGLLRLEYGIAAVIVLAPIAENAPISEPGAAPLRIALTAWLAALVVAEALKAWIAGKRLQVPPLAVPAVGLLVSGLIAVALASDLLDAASSYLAIAGVVALYSLISVRLASWEQLRPVLAALVVAGIGISLHTIWQYATGQLTEVGGFLTGTGEVEGRVVSTFSHPNQLAAFLAIMAAVGVGLAVTFQRGWARISAVALALLASLATVLTLSRGALVALIALAIVYASSRRMWPLIAAGVVAVVLLAPSTWEDRLTGIGDLDRPENATRVDLWDAGLQMFADDPLTGVGLNSYGTAYVSLERSGRTFLGSGTPFEVPEDAHNLYINTLAEQGLIGFTALAVLILAALHLALKLLRAEDRRTRGIGMMLLGTMVVMMVHSMFEDALFDPKVSILIWSVLGVSAAVAVASQREPA